ncbi:hypothetical protein [Mycobacteroides chelonae]|uniref:hypothetical protein n=1 Tax=Mycobacteroides chelonae TaxID=1774 RepID=UPI000993F6CD|nr:hypothetical protein [Mycobacteroides chelonae]
MRIRSIKPEFWRSQDISSIEDWATRLLFIGLWSYVDDNGVGVDRVSNIAADLFADDLERDPSETFARVSRGLQQLAERFSIVRYEVDGRSYLFINGWAEHQRIDHPNVPRYPLPDGTIAHPTSEKPSRSRSSAKPSRKSRETLAPGTGEQGNRGTEQKRENARKRDADPLTPVEPIAPPLSVIPDDWEPNLVHRSKAKALGITDLDGAAESFRNHALMQGRIVANWDAAFASWLASPKTAAAERDRKAANGPAQSTSDLRVAQAQALKSNGRLELE